MLTMGQPIQLKTARPMDTLGDDFANRISSNYSMLQEHMTASDMLHFIAAPPEVYMAEPGMAPLVMNSDSRYSENFNVDMINNVLNRIILSETNELTYQDRVYIENVLNKIGITDVSEFMKQVKIVQEETNNTKQLLNLYTSGQDTLELRKQYIGDDSKKQTRDVLSDDEDLSSSQVLYNLQQQVMNRLHTEEIYQEIAQRVTDFHRAGDNITDIEMQLSEQSINADYLTLNRIRKETFNQDNSLVYSRVNTYEEGDVTEGDTNYNQTVSNMLKAVLLGAVSQVYHIRYDELVKKSVNWHNLTDALHVSAENTIKRFESLYNTSNSSTNEKNEYHRSLQNIQQNEIHTLQRLIENTNNINQINNVTSENQLTQNLNYKTEDQYITEEDITEEVNNQLNIQEDEHKHVYNISQKQQTEALINQLNIINQQNIERVEKLRQLEIQQKEPEVKKPNMAQARADGLRALTEGNDVAMEYLTKENNTTIEKEKTTEALKEIIGEDTVKILQMLEGYQNPNDAMQPHVVSDGAAMDMLFHDIASVGKADDEAQTKQLVADNTRVIHETSREVERVLKETERIQQVDLPAARHQLDTSRQQVELFHKQNETAISEEFLEELTNRTNKTIETQVVENTEKVVETSHVNELITTKVNEMKVQQNREVERLINNNVKQQLSSLSDQVYSKLEKKIDSERRRRGF